MPNKNKKIKPKLLTSILLGTLLPWVYFLLVTTGPSRHINSEGVTAFGQNGVAGFIEFYGITYSVIIYLQTALACTVLVFIICNVYVFIEGQCKTKA